MTADSLPVMVDNGAKLPTRGTERAAGLDLYSVGNYTLWPLRPVRIRTGIAVQLPPSTVGQIWPRSGLGGKGVHLLGGVADEDFRGFWTVIAVLLRWRPLRIKDGDRVAQLLVVPILRPIPEEVHELSRTQRGDRGYGSTGR